MSFEDKTITISYRKLESILQDAIRLHEHCGAEGMTPGGAQYMQEVMSMYPGYVDALGKDMEGHMSQIDYSQQEVHVGTMHAKAERQAVNAPRSGDFWTWLAADALHKEYHDVTKEERSTVKYLTFHLMYGPDHQKHQEEVRAFIKKVNEDEDEY